MATNKAHPKKPAKKPARKPKPTQYALTIPKAMLEQAEQARDGTTTLEDHLLELLQRGILQVQQRQQRQHTEAAPMVNANLARNLETMQRHYGTR